MRLPPLGKVAALALACAGAVSCAPEGASSAGGKGAATPSGPGASGGGSAPDFSLQGTDGRTVHLSDYLGSSVVLIDFWSTTCNPCMAEMPYLVDLYKANKDKGFVVLAISLDGPESLADVNRVVHDKDMVFPVLLDQETTVVARYNPKREMPFAVLIDKGGSIVEKKAGYTPGDEKVLAAEVEKALR
jgi:peroxiredoxin